MKNALIKFSDILFGNNVNYAFVIQKLFGG